MPIGDHSRDVSWVCSWRYPGMEPLPPPPKSFKLGAPAVPEPEWLGSTDNCSGKPGAVDDPGRSGNQGKQSGATLRTASVRAFERSSFDPGCQFFEVHAVAGAGPSRKPDLAPGVCRYRSGASQLRSVLESAQGEFGGQGTFIHAFGAPTDEHIRRSFLSTTCSIPETKSRRRCNCEWCANSRSGAG